VCEQLILHRFRQLFELAVEGWVKRTVQLTSLLCSAEHMLSNTCRLAVRHRILQTDDRAGQLGWFLSGNGRTSVPTAMPWARAAPADSSSTAIELLVPSGSYNYMGWCCRAARFQESRERDRRCRARLGPEGTACPPSISDGDRVSPNLAGDRPKPRARHAGIARPSVLPAYQRFPRGVRLGCLECHRCQRRSVEARPDDCCNQRQSDARPDHRTAQPASCRCFIVDSMMHDRSRRERVAAERRAAPRR
jgi:hypothetical protein